MIKQFLHSIFALTIFCWLTLSSTALQAQICKEGTPPGFMQKLDLSCKLQEINPEVDWAKINEEDKNYLRSGSPLRAGISVPVGLDINNSGEWTELTNGKMLWRIALKSKGAYAIGVVFDKFELPKDAELYIYDTQKRVFVGALGSHNNSESKILSTRVLPGDEIVIEYVETPNTLVKNLKKTDKNSTSNTNEEKEFSGYKSNALLRIGELIYTYKNTFVFNYEEGAKPDVGASESCQVNINCSPVGDNYQQQKRGVAHIFFPIGTDWYFCTGSLVNNTSQDGTPYFLTAWHCGDGTSAADRAKWQFYFNYEYAGCTNSGVPSTSQVITGCTYKASGALSGGSDFYLVQLNSTPPANYKPYYNGWSRETAGATSGACIHHPSGDVKKISTFSTTPIATSVAIDGLGTSAANGVWEVRWSQNSNGQGVTEGGSSGSPLFNQNKLIVGTLTGGSSECAYPNDPDYFGCFYYHWESNGTTSTAKLSSWLDPAGTSPTTLAGYDPYSSDVEDNTLRSNQASIFPNPTSGEFTVQLDLDAAMTVEVVLMDLTGRIILQSTAGTLGQGANDLKIKPAGLSSGTYILRVQGYNSEHNLVMQQNAKLVFIGN